MSDIGLAGGVGEEQISDSGLSGAQSFSDYSPSGSDGDNYAQATANLIAQPKVGQNRSNIIGTDNYDPQFAAALQISRGLNPGVNTGGLDVPSYLQPQLTGNIASDFRGSYNQEPKYYSPVERFMQTDLADFVQSAPSLTNLIGRGLDSLMGGIDFLNNSKAGKTVEEVAEDQKRIEIAELEKNRLDPLQTEMTDPSFMGRPIDTVTKTSLDKLDDRPSIAELAEQRKTQNALNSISDMFNDRGIVSLSEADDLKNIEIAAGTNAGKTLNTALPERRDLNAFTSPGYLQSSVNPIIKENPMQGPPRPSEKAPPGFVDIVMREDQNPVFAGTNMSIFGGRDPSAKAYTPLTEAEALASDFTGFTLEPFGSMFEKNYDPSNYTASGVPIGVNLPAAEFRVKQREPEEVKRVPISSLPPIAQGINALRSEFDIASRSPVSMQDIIDGARAVESGQFSQQEMSDFLGGFGRYAK